jgi:hypothetical protein
VNCAVALSNIRGEIIGSGVWVNTTSILTAWHVVERESGGVRVIISRGVGSPVSIDGVVSFGMPGYDLALVIVNPGLFPPGYLPTISPILGTVATGEAVYSLSAALGADPNSFATGVVREPSFSLYGAITDILTDIPHYQGSSGAAIFRKCDNAIVGIIQYTFVDGAITSSYSGGVNGSILQTFMLAASREVTSNGVSVTASPAYVPGPVTYPTIRNSFALGLVLPTANPDIAGYCAVPLMVEAPQPQLLPIGTPSNGEIVYDPRLGVAIDQGGTLENPFVTYGAGGQVNLNDTSTLFSFNSGYARLDQVPYTDISSTGTLLNGSIDSVHQTVDLSLASLYTPGTFTISSGNTSTPASNVADNIFVSPLGFVYFQSALSALHPYVPSLTTFSASAALALNPGETSQLYVSPFGSGDFKLGDEPASAYGVTPGTPGSALAMYAQIITGDIHTGRDTLVIQWNGYSQVTGDPVSFQCLLTIDSVTGAPYSGQVRFAYGLLPGTWAGTPWTCASRLTSSTTTSDAYLIQIINEPRQEALIYFGVASESNTVALPDSAGSPLIAGKYRVAAPRRYPDGTIPSTGTINGTLAAIYVTTSSFGYVAQYSHVQYAWEPVAYRISSIQGTAIGSVSLNVPSLSDAIISSGKQLATASAPGILTQVKILTSASVGASSMSLTTLAQMLGGNVPMGTAPALTLSGSSVITANWTPGNQYYTASLFTVPLTGCATELRNISSMTLIVTFDAIAMVDDGIIVIQIAAIDSTAMYTQFADSDSPTCAVIYNNGTSTVLEYRSGYGGPIVTSTPLTGSSAEVTLSVGRIEAQRPCAFVIGHPPRSGNGPEVSPTGKTLMPFTFYSTAVTTSLMNDFESISQDTYAITTDASVARPLFFNPVKK